MANKIASALDAIGLPRSLEVAWEIMEGAGIATGKTMQEVGSVAIETSKEIRGQGLDMNGSLTFNENDKAKSPELVEQEKAKRELEIQRSHFSRLEQAQLKAREFAHAPALDLEIATQQFVSLSGDERKEILHVSTSADEKHFNTAYHIAAGRTKLRETQQAQQQIDKQPTTVVPKGKFQMREGELFMGNERSGGGHWTNNPG